MNDIETLDARLLVYRPALEKAQEDVGGRLKPLVNELLYANLPPSCTLAMMEDTACDIFLRIMREWDRALAAPVSVLVSKQEGASDGR